MTMVGARRSAYNSTHGKRREKMEVGLVRGAPITPSSLQVLTAQWNVEGGEIFFYFSVLEQADTTDAGQRDD